MKIFKMALIALIVIPTALVAGIVVTAVNTTPDQRAQAEAKRWAGLTTYQRCVETAERARSPYETQDIIKNLCSKLPYEKGDWK